MANTKKGNEKFGIFTDMGVTMVIDHLSPTHKQALAEALNMMENIVEMKLEFTLRDGTVIKPTALDWKQNAEDMRVLDDEDNIMQLNDLVEEGIKG